MQDLGYELPRIPILSTWVNKEQFFAVHLRFMVVRYTALNTALGRGGHRLVNDREIKELLRWFFGRRAVPESTHAIDHDRALLNISRKGEHHGRLLSSFPQNIMPS
jgi:hypothetical protein